MDDMNNQDQEELEDMRVSRDKYKAQAEQLEHRLGLACVALQSVQMHTDPNALTPKESRAENAHRIATSALRVVLATKMASEPA